jgi:hypothetical protein
LKPLLDPPLLALDPLLDPPLLEEPELEAEDPPLLLLGSPPLEELPLLEPVP